MEFGEEEYRCKAPFSSHPLKCTHYECNITIGVNFDHLTGVVFIMFLHYKIILFLLCPYYSFWKEFTMLSPALRCGELCMGFLYMECLFLFSNLFICLVIYVYQYELMNILFKLWVITQYYFICVA